MLNQSQALDRMFQALADSTRRALLQQLTKRSASVSELAEPHEMSLPAVLQHLGVLEESGLVSSEKVGRARHYRLEPKALATAEAWIADRRGVWESHFDRLGAFLDNTYPKKKRSRT